MIIIIFAVVTEIRDSSKMLKLIFRLGDKITVEQHLHALNWGSDNQHQRTYWKSYNPVLTARRSLVCGQMMNLTARYLAALR